MAPPADIPKVPGIGVPPAAPPALPTAPDTTLGSRTPPAPVPPAPADHADIRPLDVPGGLQILIAEVRAALEQTLLSALAPGASPAAGLPPPAASAAALAQLRGLPEGSPAAVLLAAVLPGLATPSEAPPAAPDAARHVVELLLQALPAESADDAPFAQRLPALYSAVQSANVNALQIIDAWRNVPVATQAAAHLAVQLVDNALGDEALQAVWLRPEWAGFLPRLERFRRRRRRLKRRLEDPDYPQRRPEDERP